MSYIDWVGGLELIPNKQDKVILELGLGEGTKFLLSEFKHVYSFEVFKTKEWYDKCVREFLYPNWTHKFIHFDQMGMGEADNKLLQTNGAFRDKEVFDKYIDDLHKFVNLDEIDVVFVDQGFHMRGESVNYFLNSRIPIVMAHDYKTGHHLYGWPLVWEDKEHVYTQKLYDSPLGLNIWFKNDNISASYNVV